MYSLTIENLAFCGLLEELYDIFCIMCAAIVEESESERANYESLKIAVKNAVKTKLETFLFKNRYLFPPDGKSIHFNVAQFDQFFAKAIVSKNVGTTYIINPSFTIFLHAIEDFVYFRTATVNPYNLPQKVEKTKREEFSHHIKMVADVYRSRISHDTVQEPILTDTIVYVSLHQVSCIRYNHKLIPDTRPVQLVSTGEYIDVPVHHCLTCGKVFIGNQTLNVYTKTFGMFLLRRNDDVNFDNTIYDSFREKTDLYKTGYNVQRFGMTEADRHSLLKRLIDSEQMDYSSICSDINDDINRFQYVPRYFDAVKKWKSDLKFIGDYVKTPHSSDE